MYLLSHLWRGDFRYTNLCWLTCSCVKFIRASGEAILRIQRYSINTLSQITVFIQALYQCTLSKHFIETLDRNSLHKHFVKTLYRSTYHSTLSKHFIQALHPSTLSKHPIQGLNPSTLSKHLTKHFIQALYQQSGRVVRKPFKNYPSKELQMY
jgi:hypothetical protein